MPPGTDSTSILEFPKQITFTEAMAQLSLHATSPPARRPAAPCISASPEQNPKRGAARRSGERTNPPRVSFSSLVSMTVA